MMINLMKSQWENAVSKNVIIYVIYHSLKQAIPIVASNWSNQNFFGKRNRQLNGPFIDEWGLK